MSYVDDVFKDQEKILLKQQQEELIHHERIVRDLENTIVELVKERIRSSVSGKSPRRIFEEYLSCYDGYYLTRTRTSTMDYEAAKRLGLTAQDFRSIARNAEQKVLELGVKKVTIYAGSYPVYGGPGLFKKKGPGFCIYCSW